MVMNEGFNFSDNLISEAKNQWGMRKDEVIDKLIAVKSFFPLQGEHLRPSVGIRQARENVRRQETAG